MNIEKSFWVAVSGLYYIPPYPLVWSIFFLLYPVSPFIHLSVISSSAFPLFASSRVRHFSKNVPSPFASSLSPFPAALTMSSLMGFEHGTLGIILTFLAPFTLSVYHSLKLPSCSKWHF